MPTDSERFQPPTIAGKVYRRLRTDIVNGTYPPGAHLVRQALAERYGVSMPSIAEACLRLESDGLVERSPQLGFRVMPVADDTLLDELIFREAIESQAARVYAARADEWAKRRLAELARELDEFEHSADMTDDDNFREFQRMHSAFHLMLAKLSEAKLLYKQMQKLWFRRLMLIGRADASKRPNPPDWHAALAEKLNRGDVALAEHAMREHTSLFTYTMTLKEQEALYTEKSYLDALLFESFPGPRPDAANAAEKVVGDAEPVDGEDGADA